MLIVSCICWSSVLPCLHKNLHKFSLNSINNMKSMHCISCAYRHKDIAMRETFHILFNLNVSHKWTLTHNYCLVITLTTNVCGTKCESICGYRYEVGFLITIYPLQQIQPASLQVSHSLGSTSYTQCAE